MLRRRCWPTLLALLLVSCDGLFGGTQVDRFPLQARAQGGFAPVLLALGPEMNPIGLNFAAGYTVNRAEAGKWNSYTAVLTRGGHIIGATNFNINNPATPDAPAHAPAVAYTMMVIEVTKAGDYELSIGPTAPPQITLSNPNLELRRNIRR